MRLIYGIIIGAVLIYLLVIRWNVFDIPVPPGASQ